MLNETMSQMVQSAGVSMPVYGEHEGAKVMEMLNEKQEQALITLFCICETSGESE